MKYLVEEALMKGYLKRRLIFKLQWMVLVLFIVLLLFYFILHKQSILFPFWFFLLFIPFTILLFLIGIKYSHYKLGELAGVEFLLTEDSIIQMFESKHQKEFKFSEIAIVNREKFGTTIVKGGWWTKIDYYRPKKSSYQIDDQNVIFVPTITSNYSVLIGTIKSKR